MGMPRRQPRALRSAAQPVCGDLPATHIREECWWWQVKAGGRESGARGAGVGRWNSRDIPGGTPLLREAHAAWKFSFGR